nr:serine/threonine-protein kinase [Kibdelosporangium sp. MJ126-NF4]CEL19245.1 serine/threonine protein kinase [Kibdelosporangium sp. MJ126-NF4]CTQ94956.1 serine/threonine protein kinase [Kibdelosporangium sp. MJ126-NF4]
MGQEMPVAGQYHLGTQVDSGGWSRIWQARDSRGREVALKEIRPPDTIPASERAVVLDRAGRAARSAARLLNQHILPIYDVIEAEETLWIVMPLVRGHSLDRRLREHGPLPVRTVRVIAAALLDALAAADASGIRHGDLKPRHVLLTDDGGVLLTDFGSTLGPDGTTLTSTGAIFGTLEYLAPEQLDGQAVTLASDLFSLGATLYEAVKGSSPFRRDTLAATLAAVSSASFSPPGHAGGIGPLITRLLSKDPNERPSLAEARSLLDDALSHEYKPDVRLGPLPAPSLADAPTLVPEDFDLWERQAGGPDFPTRPRRSSRWRAVADGIGSVFDITGTATRAPRPRRDTAWERLEQLLAEKYGQLPDNPANGREAR